MKTPKSLKKIWQKPAIQLLKIKRDTFSGSLLGTEHGGNGKRPA
jgi:microcystin-dependent protein